MPLLQSRLAENDLSALSIDGAPYVKDIVLALVGGGCWRSSIFVLVLILTLVSIGRGRQIHLASKISFYLL